MSDRQFYMLIYLILVIASGVGEYFHLAPMGTFSLVLAGVLGHSFGAVTNGLKKGNENVSGSQ